MNLNDVLAPPQRRGNVAIPIIPIHALTGTSELFLEQSNLFFHRLLCRRRSSLDGLWGARRLLRFSIFTRRMFRFFALCLWDRRGLWISFGIGGRVGDGCGYCAF